MNPDHPITPPRIDPIRTPFRETAAFRRYGIIADPDPDAFQDLYLRELIREQGFNGLPHVVSRRTLDRYIAAGEIELFRGLSAAWQAVEFRMGDFFVGRGIYSGGASTATGPHALPIARHYARGGVVVRLSLKRAARVVDFSELTDRAFGERASALAQVQQDHDRAVAEALASSHDPDLRALRDGYRALREAVHTQYDDVGRLAAYLGYDVINVVDRDYYIVLNRTAVRVQQEDMR